jgi:hypothetical protein
MADHGAKHPEGAFDRGYEGHARRQARLGLTLSPAERLRWLEQTMEELRRLRGKAAAGRATRSRSER